jgi:hypothetical protein
VELGSAGLRDGNESVEAPFFESFHVDVEEELEFFEDDEFCV